MFNYCKACGAMINKDEEYCPFCIGVLSSPLDVQEGGTHYKKCGIQPIEYIFANNLGYVEGNVVKYITRWRDKGGIEDLKKIKHYCDLLINEEEKGKA